MGSPHRKIIGKGPFFFADLTKLSTGNCMKPPLTSSLMGSQEVQNLLNCYVHF